MNSQHVQPPNVAQFRTRFLLPMLFDHGRLDQWIQYLTSIEFDGKTAWRTASIPDAYLDNTLPFLPLFQHQGRPHIDGTYLRLDSQLESSLFPSDPLSGSLPVAIAPESGVEIFIRPYGGAVVSISLSTVETPVSIAQIRDFNRGLHFGSQWIADEPERVARVQLSLPGVASPPTTLAETVDTLLAGAVPGGAAADRFGIGAVQRSFNVYTVVRFDSTIDFNQPQTKQALAPDLSALRGIWPSSHCGAAENDWNTTLQLNRRHWMAVGHQSAVHFVADQPGSDGQQAIQFNQRRLPLAADKIFFQYLYPLMQRLALQAFSRQVVKSAYASDADNIADFYSRLSPLRQKLSRYSLQGYTYDLSDEDNAARVYHYCQQALGVADAMERLERVLADVDNQLRSTKQLEISQQSHESLESQIKLQERVEWLEVFIVTVYSVKLAHELGEAYAPHDLTAHSMWYPGTTLVIVALTTLMVMLSALELWPRRNAARPGWGQWILVRLGECGDVMVRGRRRFALLWIFAALALHVISGLLLSEDAPH